MPNSTINVALVDHHTLFRKTLKSFLSEQTNINVVVQSPDVPDLLHKLKDFYVHVLLMEILMSKLDGRDAVKIIKEKYPDVKILILSTCTDIALLNDLLDLGVYGVVSKSDEPDDLIHAINSIAEQRIYRSRLFTEVLYWGRQHNGIRNNISVAVNDREKTILQLLWEEKSNREIAERLFLSVRSIEKIRQDMKEKLGVKSTVGLLKFAICNKIIQVNRESSGLLTAVNGK